MIGKPGRDRPCGRPPGQIGALGRLEEEIAVYDGVLARFADAADAALREAVARVLVNKGGRLGALGRSEEAIAALDEVLARFAEAPEPALRHLVARALGVREAVDGQT